MAGFTFAAPRPVVVVVDDEPVVLDTVCTVLGRAGCEVLRADSAETALAIAQSRRARIDLLVCDVILPGMNGPDLAERIVLAHPETLRLFMAGLPDTPDIAEKIVNRGLPFLAKPFLPATLAGKVREVLGFPEAAMTAATVS